MHCDRKAISYELLGKYLALKVSINIFRINFLSNEKENFEKEISVHAN